MAGLMELKNYQVVNGTTYAKETPSEVIKWLETSRERTQRIRVFYGDKATGRDWCEEYDTIGRIGRSGGTTKIPLLIKNSRSMGGGAILDSNIVRITVDTKDVYRHPKYYQDEVTMLDEADYREDYDPKARFLVQTADDMLASFDKRDKAERWLEFIKGNRNSK